MLRPEDTPYPFAKNIEEFEKRVEEYTEDEYFENVDRFYENMEVYKSDNPAGTVVDWIISAIEEDRGKVYAN